MRALLLHRPGQRHQLNAMTALARGLSQHGVEACFGNDGSVADGFDFVATWNDKHIYDLPQLVLEAGYINGQSGEYVRDRLAFVSAGWNGLHGRADPVRLDCPPDRWNRLGIRMTPWRFDGTRVLICDQHPGDRCAPKDRDWWQTIAAKYKGRYPVIYRPHPLMAGPDYKPFRTAIADAKACFTWNSTAAVEAVMSGIPTWAFDRGSIAWDVTAHDLTERPFLGEREQWAYNLAYMQWTHHELESGEAWEHLKGGL